MRSRFLPLLVVVVAIVGAALIFGRGDGRVGGPPLDPRSTIDDGTRAAVLLLEDQGRDVKVASFDPGAAVTMILDDLDDEQDRLLEQYLADGGQAIVFGRTGLVDTVTASAPVDLETRCSLDGLGEIDDLRIGLARGLEGSQEASCFPVGAGWLLTMVTQGNGTLVAVGSARPLTNAQLATADHAAFAVGVVQLTSGPVNVVPPGRFNAVGGGDRSLIQLIGEPVWAAVAAIGLVALVHGLHHARRLGQPVIESDPVEISSTELVDATARLYERTKAHTVAHDHLRRQLHEDLRRRWRLLSDADPELVIARLRATGADADDLRRALTTQAVAEADHVETIAAMVRARRIVSGTRHSPRARPHTPTSERMTDD